MMSILSRVVAIVVAIATVEGKERAVDAKLAAELYDSGIVHHRIMEMKHVWLTEINLWNGANGDSQHGKDRETPAP